MFKKKKDILDLNLCDGLKIDDTVFSKKENRLWTLLFKGIIVYFLSAGGVCGMISAAGTDYNPILVNIIIFIGALYITLIHYNKKWENIGNIIFLFIIIIFGFGLSLYINSGFYAVLNDINEEAKIYFDYTGIKTYAEPINNRLLAVNIAAIAIGVMCCFAHYMWIARMMYMDSVLLVLLMYIYPVYIQCEPNLIYVIMMICAGTMMYILRKSTHYSVKQEDCVLEVEDNKKRRNWLNIKFKTKKETNKNISYVYNAKSLRNVGVQLVIVVCATVLLTQIVVPKKTYYEKNYDTTLKSDTKEQVGNFVRQGFAGLFSFYDNIAGMSDGRLGGVGIVNLDYNTDFKLRITPYSEDTVYLKANSYVDYVPYTNRWLSIYDSIDEYEARNYELEDYNEADTLKAAYDKMKQDESSKNSKVTENDKENSDKENSDKSKGKENINNAEYNAKGILEIENVGLIDVMYKPYYTCLDGAERVSDKVIKMTYYPRLDKTSTKVEKKLNLTPYLRYPVENEETIAKLIKAAGIKKDMEADTVVAKLATYFQKEMPYTLNPGTTPFKADFVNYFLEEHKKGYCVHFASAATLAFRYMGIPARYVEGYAVNIDEMLSGVALKDKDYKEYYDGYSEFGETALVEVEVTDASAHAWVEIYDKNYGWKPVEVTPSAKIEESSTGSFWNRFMGAILGGNNNDDSGNSEEKSTKQKTKKEDVLVSDIIRGIAIILIGAMSIWLVVVGVKFTIYRVRYNKADINDKLILDYSRMLKKRRRKHSLLREKMNYKEQIEYMYRQGMFKMAVDESVVEDLANILDVAGFSDRLITESDNRFIRDVLYI